MKDALQGFKWDVFPAYAWKDWLDEKGRPVVVPAESFKSPAAVSRAWKLHGEVGPVLGKVLDCGSPRTIAPMSGEHVALFKTFAELSCADRDEILEFATTYGSLRRSQQHQHQDKVTRRSGAHIADGESHLTWAVEIVQMREALKLSADRSADQELRFREFRITVTINGTSKEHREIGLKPPYAKDKARLASLINSHLSDVHPRIELGGLKRLSYAPTDLLSSMWLQLSLALAEDKSYRKCKMCQRIFEISTEDEGFNKNRLFCDRQYCQIKHLRKRKELVLSLAFSETPPSISEIARQAETDAKAVSRWVKTEKKKRKGGRR